jgi:hypothetical protein
MKKYSTLYICPLFFYSGYNPHEISKVFRNCVSCKIETDKFRRAQINPTISTNLRGISCSNLQAENFPWEHKPKLEVWGIVLLPLIQPTTKFVQPNHSQEPRGWSRNPLHRLMTGPLQLHAGRETETIYSSSTPMSQLCKNRLDER